MKLNVKQLNIEIKECNSFLQKTIGFMFKKKTITYGLVFNKCNAIHTFFMRQPIDVIMTDINHHILYSFISLKPNKIILPKKNVYYTYELPIGSIKKIKE